jgi:hypothetical protein
MEYVSIFPTAAYFGEITNYMPRLDRLFLQFVPRGDMLENDEIMGDIEVTDLWLERNSCYALVMRELFAQPPSRNYRYINTFESGDVADTEAWFMGVEFVKRTSTGWKVLKKGVFVRDN